VVRIGSPVAHKLLSANDLGINGSHQAGILVPKPLARSGFFPELDEGTLNPRSQLDIATSKGYRSTAQFIFYNNKRFGGTRDEFRLTHLTKPLRELGMQVGDTLRLSVCDGGYTLEKLEEDRQIVERSAHDRPMLRLTGGWILINIK